VAGSVVEQVDVATLREEPGDLRIRPRATQRWFRPQSASTRPRPGASI